MLDELILKRVEARLREEKLPLEIRLWNGKTIVGDDAAKVTLKLNSPGTLTLFSHPDLSTLAESYVQRQIDVEGAIQDVMRVLGRMFHSDSPATKRHRGGLRLLRHTRRHDREAIRHHYDVSNDFYALWLDRLRVYSCAYFRTADDSLDVAQEQKLDLLCRKLDLQPGEQLLDVGCGWGGLIYWAAEKYGARCVGITLSAEQHRFVQQQVAQRGLSGRVEVRLQDYRDVPEDAQFDKVVSVGMFEHVGVRQLERYFSKLFRLVKPGGVVMNHGITSKAGAGEAVSTGNEFIEKYIFPDGELTDVAHVLRTMTSAGFEVIDCESLRRHYARTLWHWVTRLEASQSAAIGIVGEEKYRAWRAYLGGFAFAFEQGWNNLYQIIAAKPRSDGAIGYPMTREHVYRR